MSAKLSPKKKKALINELSTLAVPKDVPLRKIQYFNKQKPVLPAQMHNTSAPGFNSFGGGKLRTKRGLKNNLYNKIK